MIKRNTLTVATVESFILKTKIETVLGPLRWRFFQSTFDIMNESLSGYNNYTMVDTHQMAINANHEKGRLLQEYYQRYNDKQSLSKHLKYKHNQVLIQGRQSDVNCVSLHLGIAANNLLHLQDIYLANPNGVLTRPLMFDQKYPGLGNN